MAQIDDIDIPKLIFPEAAAPGTPAAGKVIIYSKADGLMYQKDDAGTETQMGPGAGGSVATDAIWDAADDLVKGTGANTAARLPTANSSYLGTDGSGVVAWKAAPVGAIYERSSASYTTTSTSFVDVDATNLALTITTLARRVRIGLVGSCLNASASASIMFDVDIDGARQGGLSGIVRVRQNTSATAQYLNASFVWMSDVLTAASHTFKLQWMTSAGTASLIGVGASDAVMQFWVEETLLTA